MCLQTSIDLRVDPAVGHDDNSGTASSPLQTLKEAFRRCECGWRTTCRISLAAGSHALGTDPTIHVPSGTGVAAEPMVIAGDMQDSGLGVRIVSSGTQGRNSTFGTVVDSAGAMAPDAYRGYLLTFLSADSAMVGQRFMIASNSDTTFTIVGALTAAPRAGDKFHVERPGASLSWAGNLSLNGRLMGMSDLRLDAPGGDSYIQVAQLGLYISDVWVTGLSSPSGLTIGQAATVRLMNTARALFSDVPRGTFAGGYFDSPTRGIIAVLAGSTFAIGRSVMNNVATTAIQPGAFVQCLIGAAFGHSHCRVQNNATFALRSFRFRDVSAAPVEYGVGHATVLLASNASAGLEFVDLSGCEEDPVAAYSGATLHMLAVTGSGNRGPAAIGLRLRGGASVRNLGRNTVTATSGDLQVGGRPSPSAWADAGALTTDRSAAASEFCQIGP